MQLFFSREEFNTARRQRYIQGVAAAAQVEPELVSILSLAEIDTDPVDADRRLFAIALQVSTLVMVPPSVDIAEMTRRLSQENLNEQLDPELQGVMISAPALLGQGVPCGLPTHTCKSAEHPPSIVPAPWTLPDGKSSIGPRLEEEGKDMGPCICDLVVQICDANCECDPDCSATEIERFSASYGVAIKEQTYEEDIGRCLSKDQFLRINAPIIREDSPICVLVNNNPSLGKFFMLQQATLPDSTVRVEFSAVGVGPWVPYSPAKEPDAQSYVVGMRIPTATYSGELGTVEPCEQGCVPGVYGPLGHLSVPFPGPNSRCVPGNSVKFWEGTATTDPCVEGGEVTRTCTATSPLSAQHHLHRLRIARRPTALGLIGEWSEGEHWLEVKVEVFVTDTIGGVSNRTLYTTDELPAAYLDGSSNLCVNVLRSLHYAIVRDGSGGISSATATVQLEHVPPRPDASIFVLQRFSVDFLDADTASLKQPALLAPLERSGKPGYINGKPVLAGYVNNSLPEDSQLSSSIEQLVTGLTIPRMSGPNGLCSVCSSSSVEGTWRCSETHDPEDTIPVLFNQDLQLGCQIQLSRAELQGFCGGEGAQRKALHPLLMYDERLRVGIWGDSAPSNHFEWLPSQEERYLAQDREPEANQAWDRRGTCLNAINAIHYQFLTADVGNVKNPQRKIIGARIEYGKTSWSAMYPDDNTRAHYSLATSVSFIRLEEGGSIEVVPPPPSILPVLPDDIFYPFAAGNSRAVPSSSPSFLAPLLSLLIVGQYLHRMG